jgi:multidrug efflux pump subunit AcrA (membrane-fusion protein)
MAVVLLKQFNGFIIGMSLLFSLQLQSAEIIPVESTVSHTTSALGSTVIPYKEVLLSAQISGRVLTFHGDVGSVFNRNQIIAEIDSTTLLAKRHAVDAQVAKAQAALRNAQTQYQRELISPKSDDIGAMPGFGMPAMMDIYMTRPMANMGGKYDSDMVRYSDLMSSATGLSQARSGVKQANAQLHEINTKLRDAKAIAPFSGMILQKMIEVGDTVQVGQPLLKFAYVNFLRLKANVPSGLVANLEKGMIVSAKINSQDETKAKVSQIYPVADPIKHTVVVKFDLPLNTVASPGMYAEVMIPIDNGADEEKKMIVIPVTALLKGRSLSSVLLVKGDTSELRLLRLGAMQGKDKVEVVSGLSSNDRIIDKPKIGAVSGWMPK